ncbi:pyridoxamine 5'-phosphate oxidase family protein [Halanaerocella petrolearia]
MLPETLLEVFNYEGVVAIATQGTEESHLVNTWNSYIHITDDERLLFPAGGMNKTESNINENDRVLITVGSQEVEGLKGQGTGFLIEGRASFIETGKEFNTIEERFPWARAAVEITVDSITQTL